jgi:hypothetical protein
VGNRPRCLFSQLNWATTLGDTLGDERSVLSPQNDGFDPAADSFPAPSLDEDGLHYDPSTKAFLFLFRSVNSENAQVDWTDHVIERVRTALRKQHVKIG